MFFSRTSSKFITITAFFSLAFTAALPMNTIVSRDVWDPRVLSPNATHGWIIGTQDYVIWDTSDAPQNISNAGRVELAKGGQFLRSGPGSSYEPLAKDFDLRTGFIEITVPDIEPGDDYQVILFGDSGNYGPFFSISEP